MDVAGNVGARLQAEQAEADKQIAPVSYTHLDVYKRQDGSNTIGDAIYIDGTRNGTLHITQGTLAFTNQARMEIATRCV